MMTFGERGYEIATGWSDAFGDFFTDLRTGFDDMSELGRKLLDQLMAVAWQAMVVKPMKEWVTAGLGALAGGLSAGSTAASNTTIGGTTTAATTSGSLGSWPVMHGGGMAGDPGLPTRRLPVGLFADDPRLHEGLAPDEFRAVLQRGETVLPRGTSAAPNVRMEVHYHGEQKSARQMEPRWEGDEYIIGVILDDKNHKGPLSQEMGW